MSRHWTFGQKLAAGFATVLFLLVVMACIGVYSLNAVVETTRTVLLRHAQNMIDTEQLNGAIESKAAAARGFILTGDPQFSNSVQQADAAIRQNFSELHENVTSGAGNSLLSQLQQVESEYNLAITEVMDLRRADKTLDASIKLFEDKVVPVRTRLKEVVKELRTHEQTLLDEAKRESDAKAANSINLLIAGSIVAVVLGVLLAFILTRTISRQIVGAVSHIQSSSTELQAAANQQATSAKENSTAMNEITTTVNELLATSRQIAESAQRVSQIAAETADGAHAGETSVARTQEAVATIKRQVEQIVSHMLDLGKKSQQIGSILEIINELSEQTNILAINATIEAAGAGETGRRFAVVAEEIRKLADRVGNSTKEIRALIDEVRASVNTTVMATETGSKAVDTGIHQFADVAASFKQIVGAVVTTTEAAREIELSTKQQTTAVEQVNVAVSNVAQTTKETEASASQTLQTASQLTGLAKELSQIVQPVGT